MNPAPQKTATFVNTRSTRAKLWVGPNSKLSEGIDAAISAVVTAKKSRTFMVCREVADMESRIRDTGRSFGKD